MSFKNKLKGWLGETITSAINWALLDGKVYKHLNNMTLQLTDGSTTQIDHIIVSQFGIFVIETKDYNCWIYGSEHQKQWTAVYKGGKKVRFQNPLHQNYRHIKALAEFLAVPVEDEEKVFFSCINFGPDAIFKTESKLPESVTKGHITYIKEQQVEVIPADKIESIVTALKAGQVTKGLFGLAAHKTHMASLEKRHGSKETCPTCGAELVKRQRKKDGQEFMGCSQFPKCRYILNLEEGFNTSDAL